MISCFVPRRRVINAIYGTEEGANNEGRDVGVGHAASDEAMIASDSPSVSPPPASSEVAMVDASVVCKPSRPPGLSDGDSSGSAPSLKKGTRKGVWKSGTTGLPS